MSGDIKLSFGEDAATGRMVAIKDAVNGLGCECICPQCRLPLVARQGEVNQWHFAHKGDSDACEGARESARHKMAKQIITDAKAVYIPLYSEIFGFLTAGELIQLDDPETEQWMDGMRADILAKWNGSPLIIEVAVTHVCEPEKIALVRDRRINCMEIDLASHFNDADDHELRVMVLKDAPRRWLYHPEIERLREEAKERERRWREMIAAQRRQRQQEILRAAQAMVERQRREAEDTAELERWRAELVQQEWDRQPRSVQTMAMQMDGYLRVGLMRPPQWASRCGVTPGAFCGHCDGNRFRKTDPGWACESCCP